jgi:hypothetical protein
MLCPDWGLELEPRRLGEQLENCRFEPKNSCLESERHHSGAYVRKLLVPVLFLSASILALAPGNAAGFLSRAKAAIGISSGPATECSALFVSARSEETTDSLNPSSSVVHTESYWTRAKKMTDGVRESASALIEVNRIRQQLSEGIETGRDISAQLTELTCTAANCGGTFAWTATKQVLPAAWRIFRFNGDFDGVKSGIVIPLVGLLREIRENREAGNYEELSRALARMTIYTVETPIKLQRALPSMVTQLNPTMMAAGIIVPQQIFTPGDFVSSFIGLLRKQMMVALKEAVTTRGLSLQQRLARFETVRTALEESLVPEVMERIGWGDLNQEVHNWKKKQAEEEAEAEATEQSQGT